MLIVKNPPNETWPSLIQRPVKDAQLLQKQVKQILKQVQAEGDIALKKLTKKFDSIVTDNLQVSAAEISQSKDCISAELKEAIDIACKNITAFHSLAIDTEKKIETMPGVKCWRKAIGIEKVGLYIPGGSAPLFSTVLMLAIPASLAGCKEIILCTPPDKDGNIHPAILYAAKLTNVTAIYKVGGAQAIAAMAYGTATIPKVFKIFGPGNQYVNTAKQLIQTTGTAIDMPAGPSEVCVIADQTADPEFVAADLLSQAEHGADSQVMLLSTSFSILKQVEKEIKKQLKKLSRETIAAAALSAAKLIHFNKMEDAISFANEYAAEHLIIAANNELAIAENVINAGSVFLGHYSPESVGDYASGTNHTLPTNGAAVAYSGVSVSSFVKHITYQQLTKKGLQKIGNAVITMAKEEGLTAHANAVAIRLSKA